MKHTLQKQLLTAGLIGSFAFGATPALATPYFSYDANGLSGAGTTFTANAAAGVSSEHLYITSPTTFAGAGWVQFTALTDNSVAVASSSYANTGLYALFNLGVTYTGGAGFGQPGSFYSVSSFTVDIYRDMGAANVFTQANATTATQASVANTATDVLLGSGVLSGTGFAFIAGNNGAGLNVDANFALNGATGTSYFYDPVPFYNLALAAFNSTGGQWTLNSATGMASIGNSTGIMDFNRVPEPGRSALLGAALLGLGFTSRRRKQ